MAHLLKKYEQCADRLRKMIITDGVFPMESDIAKLDETVALAEEFDALVFVNDSHSTGIMGSKGRSTHEFCSVLDKVDFFNHNFSQIFRERFGRMRFRVKRTDRAATATR